MRRKRRKIKWRCGWTRRRIVCGGRRRTGYRREVERKEKEKEEVKAREGGEYKSIDERRRKGGERRGVRSVTSCS